MPGKIRTWQFDQTGGPDRLRLVDVERPRPGPGEVLVRNVALSLNNADRLWLAGQYVETPKPPCGLGYEVCGVVEEAGDGVGLRPGIRVSSIPRFSLQDYTAFGSHCVLPADGLMPTPDRLNDDAGACFAFASFTGYFALFEATHLRPGDTVLMTAASSTTALAALPMAKRAGCAVIGTTRSSAKRDELTAAGFDHVVATAEESLPDQVRTFTAGRGVALAYDCVAGGLGPDVLKCLQPLGRWIVYGLMDPDPKPFPWLEAFGAGVNLSVYMVWDYAGNRHLGRPGNAAAMGRATRMIAAGLADGTLPPVKIDRAFDGLEKLPEAIARQAEGSGTGKIVVRVEAG